MVLYFLYGVYGLAYYEMENIEGITITEFLGNTENEDDIDYLASFIISSRLEKMGDDKIQYIFSEKASDCVYNDDYEYDEIMAQFNEGDKDIYLISVFVDEKQYSEIVRKFYHLTSSKLDDEDCISYNTLYRLLEEYGEDIHVRLVH